MGMGTPSEDGCIIMRQVLRQMSGVSATTTLQEVDRGARCSSVGSSDHRLSGSGTAPPRPSRRDIHDALDGGGVDILDALDGGGVAKPWEAGGGSMFLQLPRRSPMGRPFQPIGEAGLLPVAVDLALRLPYRGSIAIAMPEVVGAFGICDLGVLFTDAERLETRLRTGVPAILNPLDILIVGMAAGRTVTENHLTTAFWASRRQVVKSLPRLMALGALEATSRGRWRTTSGLRPAVRSFAFELKQDDWRSGLAQTRAYGVFADGAALVLDRLPKDRTELVRGFATAGFGLAYRDRWILKPRLRRHSWATRLWASEAYLAAAFGKDLGRTGALGNLPERRDRGIDPNTPPQVMPDRRRRRVEVGGGRIVVGQ